MKNIEPFTFYFKGKNSKTDFGFYGTSHDFLLPRKREAKQKIPFRHGVYNHGKGKKKYYDERILRVNCVWFNDVIKNKTRADIREISYWLSQEGRIELDVEPDKYYIGELYDETELEAHYDFLIERRTTDGRFELNFVCEPFAYRDFGGQTIKTGINNINYGGTAETPCVMILKNTGSTTINNIQVVATRRRV